MPILDKISAGELKNSRKAVLALDLGEKKVGVAKSDATWLIASPLKVLDNKKFSVLAEEIFKLIIENEIILVVIGLPYNADGSTSKKQQSIMQFGRNLDKFYQEKIIMLPNNILPTKLNIYFQDERFSTQISHNRLQELNLTEGMKKKFIDKLAAAEILQRFLDFF
ncbi:MAG: Holliday junction resolvase RuvX [Rickettsiales bacterium]|nr:Holliday junction resolvase RuvX [Rickettsiales bacterium]